MSVRFEFRQPVRWARRTAAEHGAIWRYGIAVAAVAAATSVLLAVDLAFDPVLGVEGGFGPFALAVIGVAWFGGHKPGLVAVALSAISWFFVEPRYAFAVVRPEDICGLSLFAVALVLFALLVGKLRESLLAQARTEEALRRQAQLIDFSHDAVIAMDPERRIITWNKGAEEMYGWPERDAVGKVRSELLRTDSHISAEEIDGILRRERRWEGELIQTTRDGRRLVVDSRQVLLDGGRNLPKCILAISRDITARKQAEEELRESEERFRTLANAMPQLVGMADGNGQVIWCNQRWYEYTGQTPEQAEGWGWQKALDPDRSAEALENWQRLVAAGQPTQSVFALRGADGVARPFLARAVPVRDRDGRVARWFGTMTDISEQRRTEDALRKSRDDELAHAAELQAIMDAMPVVMIMARDPQCRILIGNRRTYELLRLPQGSNLSEGKRGFRVMKEGEEIPVHEQPVHKAAATGQAVQNDELEVLFEDGSSRNLLANAVPVLDAVGRPRGAVGTYFDITERKQNEERLRLAQKLESIGLLAGGIAHDFNNLLTIILGSASAARIECPSCRHYENIITASERAAHLTSQLLAYAGKGQVIPTTFNLADLVLGSRELLSASVPKRVELGFNLSPGELFIKAAPSQIEQVLMNLVINAGEAIPPHADGRIEIATSVCEVAPEAARAHAPSFDVQPGHFVCLEVTDNGCGMDEGIQARVFDPFFSTKFTGRGLGLAAVQGIVRSCGGFIEVHSWSGAGSTFRVCFPAAGREPVAGIPASARTGTSRWQGRRHSAVLVVDDEEMVRELACTALRVRGYEVLEAKDGKDALEVLAGASCLPSLILLDLTMPAMGAEELVPILNRDYPDLRIIVTSGYPEEAARGEFPPRAVAGFLQKPYTVAALTEKVEETFNSGGPNEEAPIAA
ncbi:MAG TPA: PAS domain S-box protein [Bryobacteraceae bacterium]|nr:PAS domain S-box protein [Bryobacteraceae bacterium]